MGLSNAQIISLAMQIAKTPSYTPQAEALYNAILAELAESYDFDIMKVSSFSLLSNSPLNYGAGPYPLPSNYLRASPGEVNFVYQGQPYVLTQYDIARWRAQYQGAGIQDYPRKFATDFSTVQTKGNPVAYLWPPPNGAYNILWPYFMKHADIATPSTSADEPWFPMSTYLYTRLAGELMKIADDTRYKDFLGGGKSEEDDGEAGRILRKYLQLKDDPDGYAKQVKLDPNSFSSSDFRNLPNTKQVGW